MKTEFDLLVIGGGALGTFHAYHGLEMGLKVCLVEKDPKPQGATVRNFGQVVPSGFNTKWQSHGRESLRIYKDIQKQFDVSVRQNGTVYLASDEEEVQLLEELAQINRANDYTSTLLTKEECRANYPGLQADYVRAGLFFPEEITVEPREMIHKLHRYMVEEKGLVAHFDFTAIACEKKGSKIEVHSARNQRLSATKVLICNGSDFKVLFPELFAESDLEVSKIQMMQTGKQPENFKLNGSILTGWSIRRYEAFKECPSFNAIKAKEDKDSPQKKWGVHILFKQAKDGSVIIGDSHEYADAKEMDAVGFDLNMDIDNFIIEEAKKIVDLPNYRIRNRWFGLYSQCKTQDIFEKTIEENIHIVTGIGGKGMTGSAGFSKESISRIMNTTL